MSVVSELVAAPHAFRHNGKEYHVRLIDQEVKAAFEKRLFSRARDAAKALKDLMDRGQYAEHLKSLNDEYIAGGYALESDRGVAAVQTTAGMVALLSLLMGVDEAEAVRLVKECQDELVPLLRLVMRESYAVTDEEFEAAEAEGRGKKKVVA